MGVPKFYRWLSERYPLINRKIGSDVRLLPQFDNLYLDLNGIIHGCSHPDDTDNSMSRQLSIEEIGVNISILVDKMVQTVHPKKVLYLTVDGCAPRAKLNQQRARRFKSAKNRDKILKELDESQRREYFDSNVITPGTEFMVELDKFFQKYIDRKLREDPIWRQIRVIYSGHNVPGEGEHKIMEFIRCERRKPGYNPNTRHCCSSLDADLIMLGLASHEKRFSLLREEIDFKSFVTEDPLRMKQYSSYTNDLEKWELLDLSVLRQYLKIEFDSFWKRRISETENIEEIELETPNHERILDDLVLLISIIGNDFLPHIKGIEIKENGLNHIFTVYKDILFQQLDNLRYFVRQDDNRINFELLFRLFQDVSDMMSGLPVSKMTYYSQKFELNEQTGENVLKVNQACISFIKGMIWCFEYYFFGLCSWSWFYPFHYAPLASDLVSFRRLFRLREDEENKIGFDSFFSGGDVDPIDRLKIIDDLYKFDVSTPFHPFTQLLCCLPPQSSAALPPPYANLMLKQESPIQKFYPKKFELDMTGKRFEYEGVPLIPFVNVGDVLEAIRLNVDFSSLSREEQERDTFGKAWSFQKIDGQTVSKEEFNTASRVEGIIHERRRTRLEGRSASDASLSAVKINLEKSNLSPVSLNNFGFLSKNETFVLAVDRPEPVEYFMKLEGIAEYTMSLETVQRFLEWKGSNNQNRKLRVWVNCPYLMQAELTAVYSEDDQKLYHHAERQNNRWVNLGYEVMELNGKFSVKGEKISNTLLSGARKVGTGGISVTNYGSRLFAEVQPKTSISYDYRKQRFFDRFNGARVILPFELVVWRNPAEDRMLTARHFNIQLEKKLEINRLFRKTSFNQKFIILDDSSPYFGFVGDVESVNNGIVTLQVDEYEPNTRKLLNDIKYKAEASIPNYFTAERAGGRCHISASAVGKLTGALKVKMPDGRTKFLGLKLKGGKKYKVFGYTRGAQKYSRKISKQLWRNKVIPRDVHGLLNDHDVDKQVNRKLKVPLTWVYSELAVDLIKRFINAFPRLLEHIRSDFSAKEYLFDEIYPPEEFWDSVHIEFDQEELFPTHWFDDEPMVELNLAIEQMCLDSSIKNESTEVSSQRNADKETCLERILRERKKKKAKMLHDYYWKCRRKQLNKFKGFFRRNVDIKFEPVDSEFYSVEQKEKIKEILNNCQDKVSTKNRVTVEIESKHGVSLTALKCYKWFDSPTLYSTTPTIGDRVSNMSKFTVDFGKQGTIIACHPSTKCVQVIFDDLEEALLKYYQVVNISQPRGVSFNFDADYKSAWMVAFLFKTAVYQSKHLEHYFPVNFKNAEAFLLKEDRRPDVESLKDMIQKLPNDIEDFHEGMDSGTITLVNFLLSPTIGVNLRVLDKPPLFIAEMKNNSQRFPFEDINKSSDVKEYWLQVQSRTDKELEFQQLKVQHGSYYAWHGSSIYNWHNILRTGLQNMSNTQYMAAGAAYGAGIYHSPNFGIASQYSRNTNSLSTEAMGAYAIAIIECVDRNVTKSGDVYVAPEEVQVQIRYLFVNTFKK